MIDYLKKKNVLSTPQSLFSHSPAGSPIIGKRFSGQVHSVVCAGMGFKRHPIYCHCLSAPGLLTTDKTDPAHQNK